MLHPKSLTKDLHQQEEIIPYLHYDDVFFLHVKKIITILFHF